MDIIEAIQGRACRRAFLDKPVTDQIIKAILEVARWAPSGVNTQPWHVAVVVGEAKQQLSAVILNAYDTDVTAHPDYEYYPTQWAEPYKTRRFECGMALYGALNIDRKDAERRRNVWRLNYTFFGAPVGLLFFIDKHLNKGSWLDLGMFFQNVMIGAREFGLDTCPLASIADYPSIVRTNLNISDEKLLVAGMALGYADLSQPINQYRTTREPVESFSTWYK